MINYPITDYSLPFKDYIKQTRELIVGRRLDLQTFNEQAERIIDTNCPYELQPPSKGRRKYGALLVHGLLDSPFSLRDTGHSLQQCGVLCRSILLPGHGTRAHDLLQVTADDWIQAVRYGIKSMEQEVEQLYLIGYSTGAALSLLHAQENENIAGVILLAPAIKIKAPVDVVVGCHSMAKLFSAERDWIYRDTEIDYAKYSSVCFNAVDKVTNLTKRLQQSPPPACRQLFIASEDDETISCHAALRFFSQGRHPESQFLLYTTDMSPRADERIMPRNSRHDDLHIQHFAHATVPFAPTNPHYGQHGDYPYASSLQNKEVVFGAFNRIVSNVFNAMYSVGIVKNKRWELTYNPDFEFMASQIQAFIFK